MCKKHWKWIVALYRKTEIVEKRKEEGKMRKKRQGIPKGWKRNLS